VLQRLFGKQEPIKLFKGAVVIASDGKSSAQAFEFCSMDYDAYLMEKLTTILALPEFDKDQSQNGNAYILDLMVLNYQLGGLEYIDFGEWCFTWFWRPKIKIAVRVYRARDGRTRYSETLHLKMSWWKYFKNLALFRNNLLNEKGVERMLYQGCLLLLKNVKNELNL